jgi:hypothetical protein
MMGDHASPSVLLYRARDFIEASLLVAMLEEEGIPAWTGGGQAAVGFGELGADALLVDVRIPREEHARALGLVEEFFAPRRTGSSHTCPACGAAAVGDMTRCWSCGAQLEGATTPPALEADDLDVETRWFGWRVVALRAWLVLPLLLLLLLVIPPVVLWFEGPTERFAVLVALLCADVWLARRLWRWVRVRSDRPTVRPG